MSAAIERCDEEEPSLLVLDIRLSGDSDSGGEGFELVRRLRAHDRLRTLPTVIYTAFPLSEPEIDRLRLGETRVLYKDEIRSESLEDAVLSLLDR